MSPFHVCLSSTKNLSSFQLLPASLITDLLQLFLGLPLFLFPWGFQSRVAFGISPPSFHNVWPIHLNFLFLISKFISSCPVTFHRSLLEIIFGHHILNIYLRHLFTKVCILRWISFVTSRLSTVTVWNVYIYFRVSSASLFRIYPPLNVRTVRYLETSGSD